MLSTPMIGCRWDRAAQAASLLALALLPAIARAQSRPPELRYAPDLTIDLTKAGIRSLGPVSINRRGQAVVVNFYPGQLVRFDSSGNKREWPLAIGRRGTTDVAQIAKTGWVGDSMWIVDNIFRQLVVLDTSGTLLKSIEEFNWIRPNWSDRRKYPLFAGMEWMALYPDGSHLVTPSKPRAIFDSPQYDRSKLHLLRVNPDGKIIRTVARIPSTEPRVLLRDAMERQAFPIPFFAKPAWTVSTDGQRIVVVQPLLTASDSGAFTVTALNAGGDTVFSRRFAGEAARVPTAEVDKALAGIKTFGRHTAEFIRDTIRKQVPVFESRVQNVAVGVDHSVWVHLHSPVPEHRYFVIDSTGTLVGTAGLTAPWRIVGLSVDRIWTIQRTGTSRIQGGQHLVRLTRADAIAARPPRTASASASRR